MRAAERQPRAMPRHAPRCLPLIMPFAASFCHAYVFAIDADTLPLADCRRHTPCHIFTPFSPDIRCRHAFMPLMPTPFSR
jgi:hypothetical protein